MPPGDTAVIVPRVYIYFNKLLIPGPLAVADWFLRIDGQQKELRNALSRPDRVQIDTRAGPFNPGADRVSYNALTIQLRDIDGLEVAPFFFSITRT